jgi:hypothetical protein
MLGFVRQPSTADGYGLPLEVTALVLEQGDTRVVLCGVDVVGIGEPAVSGLIERVAEATGAEPAGVLLNWNHTHLAPPGGGELGCLTGPPDEERDAAAARFAGILQDKVVEACRLASERLEPAAVLWGVGAADLAVNRRERRADGRTILGWNPLELVDNSITVLEVRRPDETSIATLVSYGCHPVTTGYDMSIYSSDYPGAMRELVRSTTGGEAIFFQGAAGNVLPRVSMTMDEREAVRVGRAIALEGLRTVADRYAVPRRIVRQDEGSVTPISTYRFAVDPDAEQPVLAAASALVQFPLLPLPTLDEVRSLRHGFDAALEAAEASGNYGKVKVAWFHAGWARQTEQLIADGTAPTQASGRIHAVRIGDGVIVTGPGETFTEIGLAVKERGPGRPTLYCGYTNGAVAYFSTAAEYPYGGYEPDYSSRTYGLPAQVAPESERLLVETGVRLAESLFPDADPWPADKGWTATGAVPEFAVESLERPASRPAAPPSLPPRAAKPGRAGG